MADFKFDKRAIEKLAKDAVKEKVVPEMQRLLDSLSRSQKGKPVEDVKRTLRQQWKAKFDGDLTDPNLTAWATVLAEGGRVQVQAG